MKIMNRVRVKKNLLFQGYILLAFLWTDISCTPVAGNRAPRDTNCPTAKNGVCLTPACVHAASTMLKNMDQSADPCDDFYRFSCGGYEDNTPIPEESNTMTMFTEISNSVQKKLRIALEKKIQKDEPVPERMAKIFYKSCTDTDQIEVLGLRQLQGVLRKLGGWPAVEGEGWREDEFDWKTVLYRARNMGFINLFFQFGVMADLVDSTVRICGFDQPKFGLDRSYLVKGHDDIRVQAYYELMVDVAVLLGADREEAKRELYDSLNFEITLAKLSAPPEERRDTQSLNNKIVVEELQKQAPTVPWLELINKHLHPHAELNASEEVLIVDPNYITQLVQLLDKTDKRVLANYMMWRTVFTITSYLNEDMRDLELKYNEVLYGTTSWTPRWKECVSMVSSLMSVAVGALYARNYFKEAAKEVAEEMVTDLKLAFNEMLDEVPWMDELTRNRARKKLEAISTHIAYPEELLNVDLVSKQYEGFELIPGQYLQNVRRALLLVLGQTLKQLRDPVIKDDWKSKAKAQEVNAYYNPQENSITFPAAILQGVFFGSERPKYMNYGAIGSVIGHEITHGFDDQGSMFDKDGNLVNWWEAETLQNYKNKSKCLVDQYGAAEVEEVGLKVNGILTLGENIADNGGIKESYRAYQTWVRKNHEEPVLPGLPYTSDQLFWLSAASVWCRVDTPESLTMAIYTDVHSPNRFRVNMAYSNFEAFSKSWNCSAGSRMNPVDKCSVW